MWFVVIGAMLVAPLMTPLVAIGFAQVQGNLKLIRSALLSVLLGFTVALAIGFFVHQPILGGPTFRAARN